MPHWVRGANCDTSPVDNSSSRSESSRKGPGEAIPSDFRSHIEINKINADLVRNAERIDQVAVDEHSQNCFASFRIR